MPAERVRGPRQPGPIPASIWLIDVDRHPSPLPTSAPPAGSGPPQRRRSSAHDWLRHLLARRVGVAPESLTFDRGPWGKPVLAVSADGPAFNLAHSGPWACIAVADVRAIGIDIERVRPIADLLHLAERCLRPAQVASLRASTPAERDRAFLRAWTAEEALRKAQGTGLLDRTGSFAGPSPPGWHVEPLDVHRAIVGSVAASAPLGPVEVTVVDSSREWMREQAYEAA